MRQLHPTTFHERFAASGLYAYEQHGQPVGIAESWTIHLLPDNSRLIRVDHDARAAASGMSTLLEALCDEAGEIQRFDLRRYRSGEQVKASYSIYADHIQIGRQVDDAPRLETEMTIPPNQVIYPRMHIFTGSVIQRIIALGAHEIPVFQPDNNQMLSGIIETYSASYLDAESITQGNESVPADRYQLVSSNETSICWLDKTGLLIAYENQSWRITLKNHARSNNVRL